MAFSASPLVSASNNSGSGGSVTINTTGCDIILVVCSSAQSAFGSAPTDNFGNTYTQIGAATGGTTNGVVGLWFTQGTVGAGHTITGHGSFGGILVEGWSGSKASTPLDQVSGAYNGSAATLASGSFTPSTSGCLCLVVAGFHSSSAAPTVSSPYTLDSNSFAEVPGTCIGIGVGYNIQGSATATNPSVTQGSSDYIGVIGASFLPAAGGGGSTPWQPMVQDNQPQPDIRRAVAI